MKKKLFAILTLIAFMMTLVPMAVFAEPGVPDMERSKVEIDTQSAEANLEEANPLRGARTSVKVYLWDSAYGAVAGEGVYVYAATSRGTTSGDMIFVGDTSYAPIIPDANRPRTGYYKIPVTAADGTVVIGVKSNNPGSFYLAVGISEDAARRGDLYDYSTGSLSAAYADAIGRQQLTFTAVTGGQISLVPPAGQPGGYTAVQRGTSTTWDLTGTPILSANGLDQYELLFKLTTRTGAPVSSTEVRFSTSSSYMVHNGATKTTNPAGEVRVKLAATRAGSYTLRATQGSHVANVEVTFGSATVDNIRLVDDDNQLVARDSEFTFSFRLYDSNGAAIKYEDENITDTKALYPVTRYGGVRIEALKRPSGTRMNENLYTATATQSLAVEPDNGDLKITVPADYTDREGDYQIRAALINGKTAFINYKVQEQGIVTGLTLSYDETGVPLNGVTGAPTVKRIDAAGVTRSVNLGNGEIRFSVNNSARGRVGYNSGIFTATNDGGDAGAVTVTAVDTNNNAVATYELVVSLLTSGVKLTPPAVTPVSGDALVVAQLVDSAGSPVSLGELKNINNGNPNVEFQAYAVSTPEGAVVNIDTESGNKFRDTGKSTVTVSSSAAGTVRLQVVVTADVDEWNSNTSTWDSTPRTYTGSADVVFSNTATGTAGVLTMIVGSNVYVSDNVAKMTDTPPFNQDGRVYVAIRPVAEAFGASVDWDKATQTVTMSTGSLVIYVTVGSPTIRIVEAGVTREYTSDASAQIIGDGRVVLPFRAIGEAFGYVVEWNADTQTVAYKAAGI
jgi:hypothetical protein